MSRLSIPLSNLPPSSRRSSRRVTAVSPAAEVETLERRVVPTGISVTSAVTHGSTLTVEGSAANDQIYVWTSARGATVNAAIYTGGRLAASRSFSAADVRSVKIDAKAGDDYVRNDTALADTIDGGAGNDVIYAGFGASRVTGGLGNDYVNGRAGDDAVWGGDGNDTLLGMDGKDYLNGGNGNDAVYGGDGNDTLFGGAGSDLLAGQGGNDTLYGEAGRDALYGGDGEDYLHGGDGNDALYGGSGDDVLVGGPGADSLFGGYGKNWLYQ